MIYVIDFDPIGISTCLALQNNSQNLNFVKDVCVDGKKMARNGYKMAKHRSCQVFFQTDFLRIKCQSPEERLPQHKDKKITIM